MCPQYYKDSDPLKMKGTAPLCRFKTRHVVLLSIFMLLVGSLFAQEVGEDYASMQHWKLPETALLMSDLHLEAEILLLDGKPFEGWAYELYPEGTLLAATQYQEGRLYGKSLIWYPDGKPQMSATYKKGALNGRFLGWYQNGGVIYDRLINLGKYASDNLVDQDQDRARDETETTEREGNTDDSSRE